MWTLPTGWQAAMRKSGARPVVIASIAVQPWSSLNVVDYTQAVNFTDTITFASITLIVGTHFAATGSNAITAANIAAAFNSFAGRDEYFWAVAEGPRVYVMQMDFIDTHDDFFEGIGVSSSHPAFAAPHLEEEQVIHRFCSGQDPLFGYPTHIDHISPLKFEIDPVSRESEMSGIDITFGDRGKYIRRLMKFHDLNGCAVELYLGTPELPFSGFLQIATVFIDNIVADSRTLTLKCRQADNIMIGAKITGAWVADHPLEVVQSALTRSGIENTTTYPNLGTFIFDYDTLDPSLYAAKGHFNLSRYDATDGGAISPEMKNSIYEPYSVWDILKDMSLLMHGSFIPDNEGVWRYLDYDPSASPVYTFNAGPQGSSNPGSLVADFTCSSGGTNIISELEWELGGIGQVGNTGESGFVIRRYAFRPRFATRSSNKLSMSSKWLNGVFRQSDFSIPRPYTAAGGTVDKIGGEARLVTFNYIGAANTIGIGYYDDTTDFHTKGAARQGICGGRYVYNLTTGQFEKPTESLLEGETGGGGSGRRCYLMFVGPKCVRQTGGLTDYANWTDNHPATPSNVEPPFSEIIAIDRVELQSVQLGVETDRFTQQDTTNVWWDLRAIITAIESGSQAAAGIHAVPHIDSVHVYIDNTLTTTGYDAFDAGRGGYGTSIANAWGASVFNSDSGQVGLQGSYIVDVTIPMVISDFILERFQHGAPECSFSTPLHEIDKEPTDFVSILGAENYVGYATDGSSTAQVHEVISKEVDIFSTSPRIKWETMQVSNTALPPPITTVSPFFDGTIVPLPTQISIVPTSDPVTDNSGVTVYSDNNDDGFGDEIVYRG